MGKRVTITYDGKEHFPEPMKFMLPSLSTHQSQQGRDMSNWQVARSWVQDCIAECEELGFAFNAIVCQRPENQGQKWRAQSHLQWGVVEALQRNPSDPRDPEWKPIMVRWVTPGAHEGRVTESFFPEELYCIHGHINMVLLDQIFRMQDGEDVE